MPNNIFLSIRFTIKVYQVLRWIVINYQNQHGLLFMTLVKVFTKQYSGQSYKKDDDRNDRENEILNN